MDSPELRYQLALIYNDFCLNLRLEDGGIIVRSLLAERYVIRLAISNRMCCHIAEILTCRRTDCLDTMGVELIIVIPGNNRTRRHHDCRTRGY